MTIPTLSLVRSDTAPAGHDMGLRVSSALEQLLPHIRIADFKRVDRRLYVHVAPREAGLRSAQDLNDFFADVVLAVAEAPGVGSVDTLAFREADGQLYLGRVRVGTVEVWAYPSPELAQSIGENGPPRRTSIALADV